MLVLDLSEGERNLTQFRDYDCECLTFNCSNLLIIFILTAMIFVHVKIVLCGIGDVLTFPIALSGLSPAGHIILGAGDDNHASVGCIEPE